MYLDRLKISLALITSFTFLLLLIYRLFPLETMYSFFGENPMGSSQYYNAHGTIDESLPATENMRILFWTPVFLEYIQDKNIPCGNIKCQITSDKSLLNSSQAVVFHAWESDVIITSTEKTGEVTYWKNIPNFRFKNQYWVLYGLEPPMYFTEKLQSFGDLFNWTMTYRSDSDIQLPYGRFQRKARVTSPEGYKHLAKRKKLVALVLSNCKDVPSNRIQLVKELQKYVTVDVYGKCGEFQCKDPIPFGCKKELGHEYKFYLSFENSVCQDYVTEKLFQAYGAEMVPIVFGGGNYDRIVPTGSFINANSFPSAKSLADYLLFLNSDDDEYLKYFEWKKSYELKPDRIDYDGGYCRLCQKLAVDFPKGTKSVIHNISDFMFNFRGGTPRCWTPRIWQ